MISFFKRFGVALAVLLCATSSVFAQFDSATVLGTVTDNSGAAVPNAKITLRNSLTGVEQTRSSNNDGYYEFFNVKIGQYEVTGEAKGFKKALAKQFTVNVGARQRVDLALEVGEVSESVTVSEAVTPLESDSSSRGTTVASQQILNLPLNGRSYADLALLAPGVRRSLLFTSRDASFNVNGMRSSQNNFTLDGVDNNAYGTSNQGFSNQVVQISPDAVQEFRIETNNFSAEYGRAGGAVINATIRSGTNEFHGSAWEFLRNTELNAVGFFKPTRNQKPDLIQNQFGGTFGGAIKKNKMFFFADYEGFRRVSRTLQFSTLPTLDQRSGIYTAALRNPLDGSVLAGNRVPANLITPFARQVFADLPANTAAGASNNFEFLPRTTINSDKGDIRYDHYISEKLNAYVRYSHRLQNNFEAPNIPGPSGGDANGRLRVLNQQISFGSNYTISPSSLLEFRMGVSLTEGGKVTVYTGQPSIYKTFNIPNGPTDPRYTGGLFNTSINGFTTLGVQGSNPQFQNPYVVNPKVNYSKFLGKHSLKAGYEFQSISTEVDDFNPKYGSESYAGQFSRFDPTRSGTNDNNVADFLFGARSNYQLNSANIANLRQKMHFFYLQDDYKVNSRLTLNLGVRYEYATPQWEANNLLSNYDPTTNKLIQARSGSVYDRALVNPDTNNWAPRLGLAYRVAKGTVIRSAYGISYINFNRMGGENLLAYNLPNVLNPSINQISPALGGLPLCTSGDQAPDACFRTREQGFPNNFLSISNVKQINVRANYIPKDLKSGMVQSFHFTVQQQLPMSFVLDVGYIRTRAENLQILGDFNQARPNNPGENSSLNSRRPIPNFGLIQVAFDGGFLDYDGLQVKIERRFNKGLYVLNSFTYSRGLDNASGHLETANGDNSRVNYANLPGERGYSGYDQRWNNTLTFVYELPFGRGRKFMTSANPFVETLLGGWRFNGIHTFNAGVPINLTYSPASEFQVSGSPNYRPNVVGIAQLPEKYRTGAYRTLYLNPCNSNADTRFPFCGELGAGVLAPTDRSQPFGSAYRNGLRGPSLNNFDAGLHKQFNVIERLKLEFRAEAFNLFNTTNFVAPNSNRSSGSFGTITQTFPARQLQFALKLLF